MRYRKMDMHAHSCYSVEPIPGVKGFKFSPAETPEELYLKAKARGMDFVTITDHDTIDGCLDFLAKNPEVKDFVVGEEVSTQLPKSGLTVHINVYGHNVHQHKELQKRRADAFAVTRYCREQGLYHCWNHPFYRENLSEIEEREFMSFAQEVPVIEVRNGGRMQVLNVLAEELAVRTHRGMQGGSDTHTGDIGAVYTASRCQDLEGFFQGILAGESRVVGNHSSKRSFLFNNYLLGTRRVVRHYLRKPLALRSRAQLLALAAAAFVLSPLVVRRHFRQQRQLAVLALSRLSSLGHLSPTVLDAA